MESWTIQQWMDWQLAVLSGETRLPVRARDVEVHQQLTAVYSQLKSAQSRSRFANAVARAFEATPALPANAEILYFLLHLMAYTQPSYGAERVRQHLFLESLQPLSFARQSLHTLLLMVAGKYEITDEVVDYIQRSSRRSRDLEYLTACMRVLAVRDRRASLDLLPAVLAAVANPAYAARVARHLKGFSSIYGYRVLFEWWPANESALTKAAPETYRWFFDALLSRYVADEKIVEPDRIDPYHTIFTAWLHANRRPLLAAEVLALAKLKDVMDEERLRAVIEAVFQRQTATDPAWHVKVEAPWNKIADIAAGDFLMAGKNVLLVSEEDQQYSDFIAECTGSTRELYIPPPEQIEADLDRLPVN